MRQQQPKSSSIEKALHILSSFAPYNEEMGTLEIGRELGLHKATVSRILKTLTKHGYLNQNDRTKKFTLGPSIVDLGQAVNQSLRTNLVPIAKPFVDELRDRLKETITLEVLSGETTFIAYLAEGPQLVRLAGSLGDRLPLHAAAGSKVILAFSQKEVVEKLLDTKLERFTRNTVTSKSAILRQLEEIKEKGFALDQDEINEGSSAIGAPIFNHEETPIGAVVVAGPSQRIKENPDSRMVRELKKAAGKISAQLYSKRNDEKVS